MKYKSYNEIVNNYADIYTNTFNFFSFLSWKIQNSRVGEKWNGTGIFPFVREKSESHPIPCDEGMAERYLTEIPAVFCIKDKHRLDIARQGTLIKLHHEPETKYKDLPVVKLCNDLAKKNRILFIAKKGAIANLEDFPFPVAKVDIKDGRISIELPKDFPDVKLLNYAVNEDFRTTYANKLESAEQERLKNASPTRTERNEENED